MGNIVILEGRLGSDPEDFSRGCKFTLATDKYKSETPDWHRCVAFDKPAEIISKYCKKGSHVLVQGRIQYGSYENKEKQTVYTTDIVVNEFQFINSGTSQDKKEPVSEGQFREKHGLPKDAAQLVADDDAGFEVFEDVESPF